MDINTITEKQSFYEVCQRHDLDEQAVKNLAYIAKIDESVVLALFADLAVCRVYAVQILSVLSECMGGNYTLDTVAVKVLPTFNELHETHQLDLGKLATEAGVTYRMIAQMYANEPVPEEEARLVLQVVSRQTGHIYRIEHVDMQLV